MSRLHGYGPRYDGPDLDLDEIDECFRDDIDEMTRDEDWDPQWDTREEERGER